MASRDKQDAAPKQSQYLGQHVDARELAPFLAMNDLLSAWSVLATFSLITLAFFLAATWSHPAVLLISAAILGGRQVALGILLHEAVHRTLFKRIWLNDRVGRLCGDLVLIDFDGYRHEHLNHHRHTGTGRDPDRGLVAGYPAASRSLARKMMRDLLGLTGLKRLYGLFLMYTGRIAFTASTNVVTLDQSQLSWGQVAFDFVRRIYRPFLVQGLLAGILAWCSYGWLYGLWVVSYLTLFSLFIRIRSIGEHGVVPNINHPVQSTRTVAKVSLWQRLTFVPHYVNYHLEHHLLIRVPHYRLSKFHHFLMTKDFYRAEACIAGRYGEVLRAARAP